MQTLQLIAICLAVYWAFALTIIAIVTVASGNLSTLVERMQSGSTLERTVFLVLLPFTIVYSFCVQVIAGE